jgi:hypothetical protein
LGIIWYRIHRTGNGLPEHTVEKELEEEMEKNWGYLIIPGQREFG